MLINHSAPPTSRAETTSTQTAKPPPWANTPSASCGPQWHVSSWQWSCSASQALHRRKVGLLPRRAKDRDTLDARTPLDRGAASSIPKARNVQLWRRMNTRRLICGEPGKKEVRLCNTQGRACLLAAFSCRNAVYDRYACCRFVCSTRAVGSL